jgi:hypothetical protein
MKVKVGDTWFEPEVGSPVMVVLSDADKLNIANMAPMATKYAEFADTEEMTVEAKLAWME